MQAKFSIPYFKIYYIGEVNAFLNKAGQVYKKISLKFLKPEVDRIYYTD